MPEPAVSQVKRFTWAIPAPVPDTPRVAVRMVGPPLLLGLLAAVLAMQLQPRHWRGQAEVSFNLANLPVLASSPQTSLASQWPVIGGSSFYLEGQAKVARSPALAERVVQVAGVPGISARKFLRHSSAKPESDADVLRLSVTYRSGTTAVRLANAYATEFRRYSHERDTRGIQDVLRKTEAEIRRLRTAGRAGSPAYSALVQQRASLESIASRLLIPMSVQPADGATSFRPHALRNGLLGGVLGALLGMAVAVGIAKRRS